MGDYEKEQERLRALWEDIDPEDEPIDRDDSDQEDEVDNVSICSEYPDMEQDGDIPEVGEEENAAAQQDDDIQDETESSEGSFFQGKDGTKWFKDPPNKRVRIGSENIITHLPGVKGYGKSAKTPKDCFLLFF